jgi:6-pyruvoyltetrahydropterin/6-carboxytetrahydropterin synthase
MITIAKEFYWDMGHRLTFHKGKCINLHGHSYKALIVIEGEEDENGMLLDYYELAKIVSPLVELLDHSFLVYEKDIELLEALKKLNSKHVIFDKETTAENICDFFLQNLKNKLPENVKRLQVRIYESPKTFAEKSINLKSQ